MKGIKLIFEGILNNDGIKLNSFTLDYPGYIVPRDQKYYKLLPKNWTNPEHHLPKQDEYGFVRWSQQNLSLKDMELILNFNSRKLKIHKLDFGNAQQILNQYNIYLIHETTTG